MKTPKEYVAELWIKESELNRAGKAVDKMELAAAMVAEVMRTAEQRGIERSAEVIEQHSEYYQSNATDNEMKLSPRIAGSLTGLAYARAIRALAQSKVA